MGKWSYKLLGGAVETTGTSSTISIPTNHQNYGVTYIVKYEDDNGNTGETSVKQAAGTNTLKVTNIVINGLENQNGYSGLVAYNNRTSDISVSFKYEYSGDANAVQPSWFKFSLQDKNGNQMAVLENPTLNKSSNTGTVIISQALFASLPTGIQGNSTHTINQMIDHVGYIYNPIDYEGAVPLPSKYYSDPDDKMALYSVVTDTRTNQFNTFVIQDNYTPIQTVRISNVFLKADATPRIINLRLGTYRTYPDSTPYYNCEERNLSPNIIPYCFNYYDGKMYYNEYITLSVEYDVAGVLTTSDKTTLQVCNASDDSVIYEFEITYLANPIDTSWPNYGNTCGSSNIFSYYGGISFKDILNLAPDSGVYNIYIRWKDNPSVRTGNLEVNTQAQYCGS